MVNKFSPNQQEVIDILSDPKRDLVFTMPQIYTGEELWIDIFDIDGSVKRQLIAEGWIDTDDSLSKPEYPGVTLYPSDDQHFFGIL